MNNKKISLTGAQICTAIEMAIRHGDSALRDADFDVLLDSKGIVDNKGVVAIVSEMSEEKASRGSHVESFINTVIADKDKLDNITKVVASGSDEEIEALADSIREETIASFRKAHEDATNDCEETPFSFSPPDKKPRKRANIGEVYSDSSKDTDTEVFLTDEEIATACSEYAFNHHKFAKKPAGVKVALKVGYGGEGFTCRVSALSQFEAAMKMMSAGEDDIVVIKGAPDSNN